MKCSGISPSIVGAFAKPSPSCCERSSSSSRILSYCCPARSRPTTAMCTAFRPCASVKCECTPVHTTPDRAKARARGREGERARVRERGKEGEREREIRQSKLHCVLILQVRLVRLARKAGMKARNVSPAPRRSSTTEARPREEATISTVNPCSFLSFTSPR